MAYLKLDMYSDMLYQNMNVDLFLPQDYEEHKGTQPKAVVYLLHGMKGNSSSWFNLTAAQRYARENNIVLVCPTAHNSFYADDYFGEGYFTYITQELPLKLKEMFNISFNRSNTFIAGLSMGGYGAMLLGLRRPDLYAACASFSGAVGMTKRNIDINDPFMKRFMMPILGPGMQMKQELDLESLLENVSKMPTNEQPRILQTCGKQDYLYQSNVDFKNYAKQLPVDFTYMEWDGEHEWDFWDRSLSYAIDFFLNNDYSKKCHGAWSFPVSVEKNT